MGQQANTGAGEERAHAEAGAATALRELTQRHAEQARLFDRLLSSIADFAYTFDLAGRFTFINKALLDLWGLPLEAAVGKNFFELPYPPELAAKLQAQIQQVIDSGERLVDETSYTNPSGSTGYYQYIFSPVIGPDGAVEAVAGTTRDITRGKQLELEHQLLARVVARERTTLATIIAEAPAFICILRGPTHVFEMANAKYYELVGQRDLIGRTAREAFPEVEAQGYLRLLDQVYRTGEPYVGQEIPLQLIGPYGEPDYRYINFVYQAMRDEMGEISAIFVHGVDVTPMVRSREALLEWDDRLRTSEERLDLATDAADLGTFYCPMPLGEILWNDTCKAHFWLPPEARVDFKLFYSIIHWEDREPVRKAVEAAVYDRQPYDIEYRTVSPRGEVRWVRAKGRAYYDSTGSPTRFDGVTFDVTERRRGEESIRQSAAAFRELADAMPQIVWTARPDGVLDYYNRRWFEFIRVSPEDPQAAQWDRYIHPEDLPRVYGRWERSVQSGEPYAEEFRVRGASGLYCWFLVRALPVRDQRGQVVRWYGTCTDIEERKRAEARDQFLLALDAAVRPLTDPEEITQAHARLLGEHLDADRCAYADVEADQDTFNLTGDYNRGVQSIVGRYTFTAFGAEVLRLMRADQPYVVSDIETHLPPVGDLTPYRLTQIQAVICVPLHKDGRFVAAMAVHQKAPRQWTREEVELLRHVAARCWESIERARVERAEREARAEAEAANRAKDKFLAVLSHELRTPLSPVVMTIPAMEADPELPAKFRDDLAMVRRNIDLEVKLIDDLLDLSRVTSGKLRLELQGVRAHEVLRHAVRNTLAEAQAKGQRIREELRAAYDAITGDPGRLQQVFWNLLRNAVKFTPEGGEIVVRTWNTSSGRLVAEVQDSGVGIPPEVLPRVFDAFEQGGARMTRQFGGLGLGLAIAKAVAEMHGGTIRAASDGVGHGATFSVELQTAAARKTAALPAAIDGQPRETPLQATRVLLAEDHPDTARTMARLLATMGFEVKAACSVAAALELAAGERFDVMVSDIGLPDGTGYELMEQIRQRHGIKGIALSGYGMEEDVRRSREAGFSEHMVKPINVMSLEAVLRRVVG